MGKFNFTYQVTAWNRRGGTVGNPLEQWTSGENTLDEVVAQAHRRYPAALISILNEYTGEVVHSIKPEPVKPHIDLDEMLRLPFSPDGV